MKSKCCNVEVIVNTSNEGTSYYVCRECKEACDVACEPLIEPKFVGRWQGEDSKDSLEMALTAQVPRLTPEQWAKVRWPDWREVPDEDFHITQNVIDWAINYALQDLKPEEEAIEDLDKLLEGEE